MIRPSDAVMHGDDSDHTFACLLVQTKHKNYTTRPTSIMEKEWIKEQTYTGEEQLHDTETG